MYPKSFIQVAAISAVLAFSSYLVKAQLPYNESFKNSTAPGVVMSGSAKLTAPGIDAEGDGYLRLTENTTNQVGYVYARDSFPSNYGLSVTFEFFSYKTGATNFNQADGISFFLFDASVNAFRAGGMGGSLGYAQYYAVPGMAKGYIGISIDEFGNFSSATDGAKNGGPGQRKGAIVIRGPGNGKGTSDYVYQTGLIASDAPYNATFLGFTQRYPLATSPNYRRIKIVLTPGSSLGAAGFRITATMYKGGATLTPVTLISNFDYPFVSPPYLQFGMAASTGSITNYHEIRGMSIDVANGSSLLPPSTTNDNAAVCPGQVGLIDVTANDLSNNTGGTIDKETVDLDISTTGLQKSITDPGKGNYSVDQNGIVSFTPVNGFSGNSQITYKVNDTYGITSNSNAVISVTVNAGASPSLTLTDPPAVCAQPVNITNPALKTNTTPGASYDYFSSLTNANANTNNINASAASINISGTYYIRASYNGCFNVKPMVVQVDHAPTVANAGPDQSACSSEGGLTANLLANNPDYGRAKWTQISGPSTATIVYPNSSNCPVSNLQKGVYVFRWSIASGACAANTDDVQLSVGIVSNAGSSQALCNATSTTLQGSVAAPGTGTWTKVSGPAITINAPSDPASVVTGLTPGNTYVLAWKVVNGACTSSSTVTITNIAPPVSNAGPDQNFSNRTTAVLQANTPAAGTGAWTQTGGPAATIASPAASQSDVSGLVPGNSYVFTWTVSNANCTPVSSQVTLNDILNTTANAGPDQILSNINQVNLSGNTPDIGNTGLWTLESSPVGSTPLITQPSNPSTTVTMITQPGEYVFRWTMSNGAFSNADLVKVTVLTVLPVNIISFTGILENDLVTLRWATASEDNNSHFSVERSANGNTFTKIGTIPGAGNSSSVNSYQYKDPIGELNDAVLYYRLMQVDLDGKFSYSALVKIVLTAVKGANTWPNPFRNHIYVEADFEAAGVAHISLYDNEGKRVKYSEKVIATGHNKLLLDNLEHISPGFYILEMSKDGLKIRQKLVKY